MSDQPLLHTKIGARLRELRQARNLSVRTLATQSGFSPSFISNIESETVSPSIASLEKIAHALGVTLSELFSSIETSPRLIVRHDERATYQSAWSRSLASVLTDSGRGRQLSLLEVMIAPGGVSGGQAIVLLHDLVVLALAGEVVLSIDMEQHTLDQGDAAYLRRGMSFAWRNESDAQATLLIVSLTDRADEILELLMDAAANSTTKDEPDTQP